MADVVINTKVEAPDTSALQAIKKELKEMKSLSLNGDGVAAKRVAELTDKLEDLKDETKSLKGSGIEKLTGSFSLLTEGFRNFDTDKLKTGFKGIGGAMKAIPIFLLIEGIMFLIENFDKLKASGGLLGKVFTSIGEVINVVVQAFKDFADWIGVTTFAIEESAQKQIDAAKAVSDAVTERYSNEIAMAKATGKETTQLEIEKERAVRKSVEAQIDAINRLGEIQGSFTQKQQDDLRALNKSKQESLIAETALRTKQYNDIVTKQVEHNKEIEAKNKEAADKAAAAKKKAEEDLRKNTLKLMAESLAEDDKANAEELKKIDDNFKKKQDLNQKNADAKMALDALVRKEKELADKIASDEEERLLKERKDREAQIEQNYFNAAQGLADAFFQFQLNAAEGNEEAQLEIKKRAFQVDKAFRVAQATMDGIGSVTKTLASGGALAIPLAVSMAVLAAANVAKILATKFDGGKAGGSGSVKPQISTGSNAGNSNPSQQQLPQNQASNPQGTNFDAQGNKIEQRVYVLEEDITDTQNRIARVSEQRKF